MSRNYIMEPDGSFRPAQLLEWARWFEKAERHVAEDKVGDVRVSTVFLGIDHRFFAGDETDGSRPILFETMIFGDEHDEYQERYCTREEALVGHSRALAMVQP